jgi:hypothetical protein
VAASSISGPASIGHGGVHCGGWTMDATASAFPAICGQNGKVATSAARLRALLAMKGSGVRVPVSALGFPTVARPCGRCEESAVGWPHASGRPSVFPRSLRLCVAFCLVAEGAVFSCLRTPQRPWMLTYGARRRSTEQQSEQMQAISSRGRSNSVSLCGEQLPRFEKPPS